MRRTIIASAVAIACVGAVAYQLIPSRNGHAGLEYVAIGIDEDHSPLVLEVKVHNKTGDNIEVTDCSAELLYTSLVAGDFTQGNMPPSFSPEVGIIGATPVVIPANSTVIVQLAFDWILNDSIPPAAAACQVIPILQTEAGNISTEPVAFVVTHNAKGVREAGGFRVNASESSARDFLHSMDRFDGKKSKRIQFLIKALRERLNGANETLAPFI